MLAKLPGTIQVVGDDITDKYLLLANSHDGSSAVQIKFTPIRVVCNNTLTIALNQGDTIRIPHTRDVRIMLKRAEQTLGIVNRRYNDISKVFKAMAACKLNSERVQKYMSLVFSLHDFEKSMQGVFSTSINRETFDKSKFAYKDPAEIEKYLLETVTVTERLKPVYNLKAAGE